MVFRMGFSKLAWNGSYGLNATAAGDDLPEQDAASCLRLCPFFNSSNMTPAPDPSPSPWLIRIPEAFTQLETEILSELGAEKLKKIGREFLLVRVNDSAPIHHSAAAKFLRWNLPAQHLWPCCPKETPGFVEKAAQALWRKFGERKPQTILIGAIDPGATHRYYQTLASNLRGRTLQLFPPETAVIRAAEDQDCQASTLFCLVGQAGLFCGMQTPTACGGFFPGGTKFIRQNTPGTISRAGAKIAEALHHLALYRQPPAEGGHWLELGASPGGMTSELLQRNYRVTAVDRAAMDPRLANMPGLTNFRADVADFRPGKNTLFDAMLCDMNGAAVDSIEQVCRLSKHLRPGGLLVFTLKLAGTDAFDGIEDLATSVTQRAAISGLRRIAITHLTSNRHEFTLFFELVA